MSRKPSKNKRRLKVHRRLRGNGLVGLPGRPRLCVFRSLKHTYAQIIDDSQGSIVLALSTLKLNGKKLGNGANVAAAQKVGQELGKQAREKGIESVVFDRGGYIYHGRVKALAEAAREAGLKF